MVFDPDKFLEETPEATEGFNPDKFLEGSEATPEDSAVPSEPSQLEAALRGGAQGLTFDFADEIAGAGKAAYGTAFGEDKLADILETYRRERDDERGKFKAAEEAHPGTYLASEIAGGIAPALASGGAGAVANIGKTGLKTAMKEGAKAGAKFGAAQGLGRTEADLTKGEVGEAATDVAVEAATGAAMGGALPVVGKAIKGAKTSLTKGAKDYASDKLPTSINKIIDAAKEASKGTEIVGGKVQTKNLEAADKLSESLKDFLGLKAKKEAKELVEKGLSYDKTINMTDKLDGYINKLQTEYSKLTPEEDSAKMINAAIKQLQNEKENFITTAVDRTLPTKKEAIKKLNKKLEDIQFQNDMGVPQAKAIDNLFNKAAKLGKEGFDSKSIDAETVAKDFNLGDSTSAIEMIKDIAKLNITKPKVNAKTGEISDIPQELVQVIKKYQPTSVEEVGDRVMFKHGPKVYSEKFRPEELYAPAEMTPRQIYGAQKNLYKTMEGADKPIPQITGVAKGLRDDLGEALPNELKESFESGMKKYQDIYGATDQLADKRLLSPMGGAEVEKGVSETSKKVRDFTPYQSASQEAESGLRTKGIEKLDRLDPEFAKTYKSQAEDIGKLTDLNRAADISGISSIGGSIESIGVRGGALAGHTARNVVKAPREMGKAIKHMSALTSDKLREVAGSIQSKSPKTANFLNKLAETESETTRSALLFKAMQNPDTRADMKEMLGFDENGEEIKK